MSEQPEGLADEIEEEASIDLAELEDNAEPTEEPAVESADDEEDLDEALIEALKEAEGDGLSEVEFEGKTYKVAPELKDALLRQSDYTRKTQEVAEQRKQIEEQQAQFQQMQAIRQQNQAAYAKLSALDMQIAEYDQVDWQAASTTNPEQAQAAFMAFQQLKDQRGKMAQEIQMHESQAIQQQRAMLQQQAEKGRESLANEIPNWSPELQQDLTKYSVDTLGFTEHEINNVYDPRHVKVLHKAYMYDQMLARAKKAKTKTPDVQPVKTVKGTGPSKKDPRNMSTEDWIRQRNKEVQRRKA